MRVKITISPEVADKDQEPEFTEFPDGSHWVYICEKLYEHYRERYSHWFSFECLYKGVWLTGPQYKEKLISEGVVDPYAK